MKAPATTAAKASATTLPTITPKPVTATRTGTPVVSGRETATPTQVGATRAVPTPTPARLGNTGIASETAGPFVAIAGLGLCLGVVMVLARKLRKD